MNWWSEAPKESVCVGSWGTWSLGQRSGCRGVGGSGALLSALEPQAGQMAQGITALRRPFMWRIQHIW